MRLSASSMMGSNSMPSVPPSSTSTPDGTAPSASSRAAWTPAPSSRISRLPMPRMTTRPGTALDNSHLHTCASGRVIHMNRAGHARVERMDGPEDFQRLFGIRNGGVEQGLFPGAALALRVARRSVPGARDDELVVRDLLVFDDDPVAQRTPGRFFEADALGLFRPGLRIPLTVVGYREVPGVHVVLEDAEPGLQVWHEQLGFERASGDPPHAAHQVGGLERRELPKESIDRLHHFRPFGGVRHENAREWPDFHGPAVVARSLEPRIAVEAFQRFEGRVWAGVLGVRLALPWVSAGSVVAFVFVVGVGDRL